MPIKKKQENKHFTFSADPRGAMDGDRDLWAGSEQGAGTGTSTADSEQGRPEEKAGRQRWLPVLGVSRG